MNADSEIILKLKYRFRTLISLYEKEYFRTKELENEVEKLKQALSVRDATIKDLESKNEKLRLATAFRLGSEDTNEAKRKIGKLVREIDKCMALLNQ